MSQDPEHDHDHHDRPNVVKEFFTNWREFDGSLGRKVALTFRNRMRALTKGCCGHHGQPGC